MKKLEYNCDRCGKEIVNPYGCYVPTYAIREISARIDFYAVGIPRTAPQRIDLCKECSEKFISFLESGD